MLTDIVCKDHVSGHAAQYASVRPEYPHEPVATELQQAWLRAYVMPGDRARTMQKVISWPLSIRVAVKPT